MNQESKKPEAAPVKKAPPQPTKAPEMENLLQDFGGHNAEPTPPPAPAPTPTSAPAAPRERKSTEPAPKTAKEKPAAKKSASKEDKPAATPKKKSAAKDEDTRATKTSQSKKPDASKKEKNTVRASTASPAKREESKKEESSTKKKSSAKTTEAEATAPVRSTRPAHRVMPYVLIFFAVFIGVSLFLNLACNPGNRLQEDPSAHWMGAIGYYLCYVLFGLLGPAVFVLPFLLLNLSFFWKKYIDNRIATFKILSSLLFLLLLASLIHILNLEVLDAAQRSMTAAELFRYGAQMTGGGVIGGWLGYLMYGALNLIGSLLICLFLMAATLFYCLGMTPQRLWNLYRMNRAQRKQRKANVSVQEAEQAENKAKMEEKIRKTVTAQSTVEDVYGTPDGAVEIMDAALRKKESPRLAPMPIPDLAPNDGSQPFVPTEVSKKLSEAEQEKEAQEKAAREEAARAAAEAAKTPPVAEINPAQNRDAAVEPIFPKSNDPRQARRVPKEDRSFDLKNVFIDLEDDHKPILRKHAELPPEAPLPSAGTAVPARKAGTTAPQGAPVRKPATAARPTAPGTTAQASPVIRVNPLAQAAANAKADGTTGKPVFRKANADSPSYGLSNEEFEKMEAAGKLPPKAGARPAKPGTAPGAKPATKAEATVKGKIQDTKNPVAPTKEKDGGASTPAPFKSTTKKYVFPPISYLHPAVPMTAENRAEIEDSMNQLAETLANFHVSIKEIDYACGPTATRYEVFPAPGVRVRSFVNLADDISLALAAGGIRIEAPIPGKSAVGIEVPNKNRCTVYLRELIESKQFSEASSKLTACLGADITGKPLLIDIAKMPHLLVAGTTGSGKSVCINGTIMSLLYKAKPDEVKLVLIDPKKVEFSIYKNIPHLMAPIVTTPKDAAGALQAAVEEMERRFELFEQVSVHDLKGYNEITKNDPDMPFLPQIVIIIDELADLMMTAPDEVETAICRIAQKARAAGMHLIVGTQRPSVDVVTGLIKSNIPSRIAFTVASQVDSKTILDYAGAEKLAGRGDMLFAPIGALKPSRVQGAYVDDKEVEKICEFLRATTGTAQYDEKFISKLKELAAQCGSKGKGGGGGGGDSLPSGSDGKEGDNKYADAVRVAIEEKRVSTSLLQRKLEIGYSRAAKIIDRMQAEGIVSPPDGSKPRAILITPEEYMDRFMNGDGGEEA